MTSIFEGHPPKTRPFPIKTRVIWVPGIYIYDITIPLWKNLAGNDHISHHWNFGKSSIQKVPAIVGDMYPFHEGYHPFLFIYTPAT